MAFWAAGFILAHVGKWASEPADKISLSAFQVE